MKKNTLLALLLFAFAGFSQSQSFERSCFYDYDGKIGTAEIQLSLYLVDSKGKLKGNYCYKKYETKIELEGHIKGDKIELTEFIDGKVNGYFSGRTYSDEGDFFEGTWTNRSKTASYPFTARLGSICHTKSFKNRYNSLYGSDDEVESFMKRVRSSILKGDKVWIANHVYYPIDVNLNKDGKRTTIKNKTELITNFNRIFHQEFKNEIKSASVCNMFNNYQGVMLGDGQIWVNNTPGSTKDKYGFCISTINNRVFW